MKKLYFAFLCISLFVSKALKTSQPEQKHIVLKNHTVFVPGFTSYRGTSKKYQEAFSNKDSYSEIETMLDQSPPKTTFNRFINRICEKFGKPLVNRESFMGQGLDIVEVKKQIKEKNAAIVYGSCKGASTIINALANDPTSDVRAIVLEGCISDTLLAIDSKLAKVGIPSTWNLTLWRLCFPNYPSQPIPPVQAIPSIANKNLPILLLHSREDKTAPFAQQALLLYKTFKNAGFNNVYLTELSGAHCTGIKKDKDNYLKATHSFYKHFGLKYDAKYATEDMSKYTYDITKAEEEIESYKKYLNAQRLSSQKKIFNITGILSLCALVSKMYYTKDTNLPN